MLEQTNAKLAELNASSHTDMESLPFFFQQDDKRRPVSIVPPRTRSFPLQMSYQPAEGPSSRIFDSKRPGALSACWPSSSTSAADPKPDPSASHVAPERTPWSWKRLLKWIISNYTLIIAPILVIAPVVLLVVSSIGPYVDQIPPDENGVSFGCNLLRRPN